MQEEWRQVPDFPGYEVSNLGQVRSWHVSSAHPHELPHKLYPRIASRGRLAVKLFRNGKAHAITTYRLVLLAFVGPCPRGMEGCHNDGDYMNNRLDNLRWDTRVNNWADRRLHGTDNSGERSGRTTLTTEQVKEIRELYATGETYKTLSINFGVSESAIGYIVRGKTWKSAGGPISHVGKGHYHQKLMTLHQSTPGMVCEVA